MHWITFAFGSTYPMDCDLSAFCLAKNILGKLNSMLVTRYLCSFYRLRYITIKLILSLRLNPVFEILIVGCLVKNLS